MKLQDKLQEIRDKFVPCNCDEAYKSRGLTAPDCPQCSTDVEEAMIAFAKYCCERHTNKIAGFLYNDCRSKPLATELWNTVKNIPLITDEL